MALVYATGTQAAPIGGGEVPSASPHSRLARPDASTAPVGLSPATLCAVYSLPCQGGSGKTIAIVDAFNDPSIASDLAVFKAQFGITGCNLTAVDQRGKKKPPRATDSSWAVETSLDVEWVCAMAPLASILLVEANTNTFSDLMAAEDIASSRGQYVSNSWGAQEFAGETSYDIHFAHAGVSAFVSSGDAGLGAQYPSASPNVISIGGTTLTLNGGTLQSETGWRGSGGGCSAYEAPASAQVGHTDSVSCTGKRATPDVSFDADPVSGVAIYSGTSPSGQSGWFQIGGTSLGAPMRASISALSGGVVDASAVYGLSSSHLRDILAGNNGASCQVGYDLVTGRGSPIGAP
jgi:subtilase family serine protease